MIEKCSSLLVLLDLFNVGHEGKRQKMRDNFFRALLLRGLKSKLKMTKSRAFVVVLFLSVVFFL